MIGLFYHQPWSFVTPKLVYFYLDLKEAYLLYSNKMYQVMYYVIVENLHYHLYY